MNSHTGCLDGHFIVSGERIEIRPLANRAFPEGRLPDGRFPTLMEVEREYIKKVLAHVGGNRSKAAALLGIDRVSLWRKLKKFEATDLLAFRTSCRRN